MFRATGTGPKTEFAGEIETQVHTAMLESLFYKTKTAEVNQQIELKYKPRFDAKLCLRDTLQRIYDAQIKQSQRELSLQSLKIQQETRQKLANLREAQAEANQAAAQSEDTTETLEQQISEIQTLAGQQQQVEDQIESMKMVIEREFAGLDPDIQKARK